jgi:hypothetical protein
MGSRVQQRRPPIGYGGDSVIELGIFDPTMIEGSGRQTIRFNNFALMFIEDQQSQHGPVVGRFLYYVSGEEAAGPQTGSLVRYLRLVE